MDPGSILKTIPRRMGVYFLKDSGDRIIYIGKAVDLRSRVRSHLTPGPGKSKAARMAARTASVDYIPCETEVEALILENSITGQPLDTSLSWALYLRMMEPYLVLQ